MLPTWRKWSAKTSSEVQPLKSGCWIWGPRQYHFVLPVVCYKCVQCFQWWFHMKNSQKDCWLGKNMFCLKNERYGSQPGWKQGFGSEHVTSWNLKFNWSRVVKCIVHSQETTWSRCITVRSRSGDGIVGNPQAWPGLQPFVESCIIAMIS